MTTNVDNTNGRSRVGALIKALNPSASATALPKTSFRCVWRLVSSKNIYRAAIARMMGYWDFSC